MRFALVVEYDGTDFSGSQFQANARTVQGDLERAARIVFGDDAGRMHLASRTDAGVHALGQIAAFDSNVRKPASEIRNALNGNLACDVRVHNVKPMPDDFDPRRDAIAREYRYVINDAAIASPINRRVEYHVRQALDVSEMVEAARFFEGTHDFASFAAASKDDSTTVRHVESARVYRRSDNRLIFDIRANAFVRQQIRRMVATLISVGNGSSAIDRVRSLVEVPTRNSATQNAPPHGLTLLRVAYSAEIDLNWPRSSTIDVVDHGANQRDRCDDWAGDRAKQGATTAQAN